MSLKLSSVSPRHPLAARPAECSPESWATFRTRQPQDDAEFVRTCGMVLECPGDVAQQSVASYQTVPDPPVLCDRDKVACISSDESACHLACYQISEDATQSQVVACGNTTAAVLAYDRALRARQRGEAWAELPGGFKAKIDALTTLSVCESEASVYQTWRAIPFELRNVGAVAGHLCAEAHGPLNDYLIVLARHDENVHHFPLAQAKAIWEASGSLANPLLSRMAVVQPKLYGSANLKFFTCGHLEHPSAPLTGLAVVALADRLLGWLDLVPGMPVHTSAGPMLMPELAVLGQGESDVCADLRFPEVLVNLEPRSTAYLAKCA